MAKKGDSKKAKDGARMFMISGVLFLILGIAANIAFIPIGIALIVIGLANQKKGKK